MMGATKSVIICYSYSKELLQAAKGLHYKHQ